MYIVFICSFIALALTYLESRGQLKGGMKWGFLLITTLGVIHYDYGNDYMNYYDLYRDITQYRFDLIGIIEGEYFKEPGWALLCWLFKPFGGFFGMVAGLNIFQNLLVYRIIRREVQKSWWPMSVFIYLFSTSLYLLNFSMMRQGLVVCVFFGLWPWIRNRKWIRVVIVLLLCASIHQSAFILLPFAFWGFLPVKNGKIWVLAYMGAFAALWLGVSLMSDILSVFSAVQEFENYMETYGNSREVVTYRLGYVLNQIPLALGLFYLYQDKQNEESKKKLVVALACINFLITPFASIIPLISRIQYYFIMYSMICTPLIYNNIKIVLFRYGFLSIFVLIIIYDYLKFYNDPVWIDKYSTFKTIISLII